MAKNTNKKVNLMLESIHPAQVSVSKPLNSHSRGGYCRYNPRFEFCALNKAVLHLTEIVPNLFYSNGVCVKSEVLWYSGSSNGNQTY